MELLGHREYALVIFITNYIGIRHNRILRGLCLCLRGFSQPVFSNIQLFTKCLVSVCPYTSCVQGPCEFLFLNCLFMSFVCFSLGCLVFCLFICESCLYIRELSPFAMSGKYFSLMLSLWPSL